MKTTIFSAVAIVMLSGCATSSSYSVADGPQAGSVLVTYQTRQLDDPPLSLNQANHLATSRCGIRGYSYTELEVAVSQRCSAETAPGKCALWKVESTYECAGNSIAEMRVPTSYPVIGNR